MISNMYILIEAIRINRLHAKIRSYSTGNVRVYTDAPISRDNPENMNVFHLVKSVYTGFGCMPYVHPYHIADHA